MSPQGYKGGSSFRFWGQHEGCLWVKSIGFKEFKVRQDAGIYEVRYVGEWGCRLWDFSGRTKSAPSPFPSHCISRFGSVGRPHPPEHSASEEAAAGACTGPGGPLRPPGHPRHPPPVSVLVPRGALPGAPPEPRTIEVWLRVTLRAIVRLSTNVGQEGFLGGSFLFLPRVLGKVRGVIWVCILVRGPSPIGALV